MSDEKMNNAETLALLLSTQEKLREELRNIEKTVYELETEYLHDSNHCGSVLKGFESFLSSSRNGGNVKRSRALHAKDRIFSLSSVTAPAAAGHATRRETDGRTEGVQGINKSGNLYDGPGIQKRERPVPRDGKRTNQAIEQ